MIATITTTADFTFENEQLIYENEHAGWGILSGVQLLSTGGMQACPKDRGSCPHLNAAKCAGCAFGETGLNIGWVVGKPGTEKAEEPILSIHNI